MSVPWSSLPSLPLGCILDYLCVEDALAALSTCRNWRNNIFIYHGKKDTLKLNAKNLERSAFLTRIFKKHVKALHIYVDCSQQEFNHFMDTILPEFMDTQSLKEFMIVGPAYIQQTPSKTIVKLKRVLIESLLIKHMASLNRFAMLGCVMDKVHDEKALCILQRKNPSFCSSSLTYKEMSFPSDVILTRNNISKMIFSNIKHMILEYEYASTEAVLTLTQLSRLAHLTLNIYHRRNMSFEPIEWRRVNRKLNKPIEVSVNIVGLPSRKFEEVMDIVLCEGLALTSLKVMFCKTLDTTLVRHVSALYPHTLRELVWADAPHKGHRDHASPRANRLFDDVESCNVNPFIYLCWQCQNLRRLVIHGYWVWQYDMVGMVRLRRSLVKLEVSAVREHCDYAQPQRVLAHEAQEDADVQNLFMDVSDFSKQNCSPVPWSELHPGLQLDGTPQQRAHYIVQEATKPLGVRLNDDST